MRKTINIIALIYFIWLLLDAFNIPDILLNFLLVGEVPVIKTELSPSAMLIILALVTVIILVEILSRRISILRRMRQTIIGFTTSHFPRRLNRA